MIRAKSDKWLQYYIIIRYFIQVFSTVERITEMILNQSFAVECDNRMNKQLTYLLYTAHNLYVNI